MPRQSDARMKLDFWDEGVIHGTSTGDLLPGFVGWNSDAAGLLPAQ